MKSDSELYQTFKQYCFHNITARATDISPEAKQHLLAQLKGSPFRSVVQAWSVLDFYTYSHLHAEGYSQYFGWPDEEMNAKRILDIVHPDDQAAFGMLYYLVLEGLMHMPIPVKDIGHFCISYRIRTASGAYVKVLETNSIIASDEALNIPLICLSQMSRIDSIDHTEAVKYYFLLFSDAFDSMKIMGDYLRQFDPVVNIFSQNELKIARLIRAGQTSKAIADQVCLSKHTVDRYRKNMLEKTQCKNAAALITYLERMGLI